MTDTPAFYGYGQTQPSASPIYNYGYSISPVIPVFYGYVVGFLPVQAVNPQPYLQTMAATMPFLSSPMNYAGIFDRTVSPVNGAYPVIMSPFYQDPLSGLLQKSAYAAPYYADYPQPKRALDQEPKRDQVPTEPLPKLDTNNNVSAAPEGRSSVNANARAAKADTIRREVSPAKDAPPKAKDALKPKKPAAEPVEMSEVLDAKIRKALMKKDNEKVLKLLAGKPITKLINSNGESLLSIACECENFTIAKGLLKAGVEVNQVAKDGNTALHMACDKGTFDLVEMLLDCGADSLLFNVAGMSPLHVAAQHNNPELMKVLANSLIDKNKQEQINLKSPSGYTPLILAAAMGHSRTVETLLEYAADPWLEVSAGTHKGKTAYDFANMHWWNVLTKRKLKQYMSQ